MTKGSFWENFRKNHFLYLDITKAKVLIFISLELLISTFLYHSSPQIICQTRAYTCQLHMLLMMYSCQGKEAQIEKRVSRNLCSHSTAKFPFVVVMQIQALIPFPHVDQLLYGSELSMELVSSKVLCALRHRFLKDKIISKSFHPVLIFIRFPWVKFSFDFLKGIFVKYSPGSSLVSH